MRLLDDAILRRPLAPEIAVWNKAICEAGVKAA
jgi:hypothetical protein